MCLITRFPKIITKKDLVVYKILKKDLTSPWKNYSYNLNQLNQEELSPTPYSWELMSKFFAKDIFPDIKIDNRTRVYHNISLARRKLTIYIVTCGYHAYRTLDKAIKTASDIAIPGSVICKCIIPSGSEVCINYNEIVSNQLIVQNIIEL